MGSVCMPSDRPCWLCLCCCCIPGAAGGCAANAILGAAFREALPTICRHFALEPDLEQHVARNLDMDSQ